MGRCVVKHRGNFTLSLPTFRHSDKETVKSVQFATAAPIKGCSRQVSADHSDTRFHLFRCQCCRQGSNANKTLSAFEIPSSTGNPFQRISSLSLSFFCLLERRRWNRISNSWWMSSFQRFQNVNIFLPVQIQVHYKNSENVFSKVWRICHNHKVFINRITEWLYIMSCYCYAITSLRS
jgi:hypothetical protein